MEMHHPSIQTAALLAERFCGRWFRNDTTLSMLVIMGESGCGKTHIAKAILRFCHSAAFMALEKGGRTGWADHVPSSRFVAWPEIVEEFKRKEFSSFEDMKAEDLLIIDDIGAEDDPFKQASNILCQVLSRRERKFTVITTNIKREDWAAKFDVRIADRLLRNSVVIDMFGVPSYAEIN
jgi:DNA replication protein DnaC